MKNFPFIRSLPFPILPLKLLVPVAPRASSTAAGPQGFELPGGNFSSLILQQVPRGSSPELLLYQDALLSPALQKVPFATQGHAVRTHTSTAHAPTAARPTGASCSAHHILERGDPENQRLLLFDSSPHST